VLDPALLRPGRFDRRVVVSLPDVKGREQILAVHTKKIPLGDDVDLGDCARDSGFAGADLANLVNEAALLAARFRTAKW
jgi:cell division protease FtsH